MKKYKISIIILIMILGISLFINFNLYNENKQFVIQDGARYLLTVRSTLFHIQPGDAERWSEYLQNEDGEMQLERYVSRLNHLSKEYNYMNVAFATPIQTVMHELENEYLSLRANIEDEKAVKVHNGKYRRAN